MLQFNNNFLNHIIYGCIEDTAFLKQIRQHFPIDSFRAPIRMKLAELLYDYLDNYKECPGDEFYNLFDDFIQTVDQSRRDSYIQYIGVLKDIANINKQYILDNIFKAIRHIRIEEALADAAKLVKQKKYDDAERLFLNAMKDPTKHNFHYIDYFTESESLIARATEEPFIMKSMITAMDKIIGGFKKGETIVWVGTPKSGKTFGLVSMTHAALMQGLVVVFISLELHRYRIAGRMDQTTSFLGGLKQAAQEVMIYRNGKWVKVQREIATIYDTRKSKEGRDKLARFGGKLIIASAPGGTKNFRDIRLFLDELEQYGGVMPNVLVVDYLRNTGNTVPNQKRKEKVSENCLGLVSIGQELGCVVHTAQQGNRQAMKSKVLTPDMVADDIDLVGFADIIPTICQTEAEEKENKARIYLSRVRDAPQGAQIEIVRDLTRGQFHLDSKLIQYEWDKE